MLPTVTLFGRLLPTYGVLAVVGILLGMGMSLIRCRRFGLLREDCLYVYAFGLVGCVLGAKLLYLLLSLPQLLADLPLLGENPALFLGKYVYGGMVFYGGVIGAALGALGCAHYFGWKLRRFFPAVVPALPLVHALGRVGCFCTGCCYGVPVPWGIAYTTAPLAPNAVPLVPVQLIEAGVNVVLCLVLIWFADRRKNALGVLGLYLVLYAPVRFVLEYFRGDAVRGFFGPLSSSQWISLGILAAGLILLGRGRVDAATEYPCKDG